MRDIEELARLAIDAGFHIHKEIGPGLLESVYEAVLALELTRAGFCVGCVDEAARHWHGTDQVAPR